MKRAIFILFIFFSIITKNTECQVAYISYTLSAEYEKGSDLKFNNSLGYEAIFFANGFGHNIGFFAHSLNHDTAFNLKYAFYFGIDRFEILWGPGLTLNAGKKNAGISPLIDFFIGEGVKLNVSYRYNINLKKNNSHEFGLTFSFIEILSTLMMGFS